MQFKEEQHSILSELGMFPENADTNELFMLVFVTGVLVVDWMCTDGDIVVDVIGVWEKVEAKTGVG